MTSFEEQHARSIEETPATVIPIPPLRRFRVLIGSVVRKPPVVVQALLRTLAWQQTRQLDVTYHFIADFDKTDAFADASLNLLGDFIGKQSDESTLAIHAIDGTRNDYGEGPETRNWQASAWHRVGALKNQILQRVLDERFDAAWLVDADVLCDPTTLQSLWDADEPIVAGVYWTHWQKPHRESGVLVHAGPQVWLRHPYILHGRGHTEQSFRDALVRRQKVRVWGLGACTLIRAAAIAKGCNFTKVYELPPGPMGDGEDRHFSAKADALHLPLYADAWPDIYHAYHPENYGAIEQQVARLSTPHPSQAGVGDLVSAVVRNLEQPDAPPAWLRGRLGTLDALPEVEEALASLKPGDSRLVRAHFPVHYPFAPLRGQTRILEVLLLDVKPFCLPPTIDEEILLGARLGSTVDATSLTDTQLSEVIDDATSRA